MNEKELVYTELDNLRQRCFEQRKEIRALKKATDENENVPLRREAARYKQALSNILYRLDNGGVSEDDLRSIVSAGLALRGMKEHKREAIRKVHAGDED